MKKNIALCLILVLVAALFAGCAGTPVVYYTNCTCPTGSHQSTESNTVPSDPVVVTDGSVKTGLAILTSVAKSENAAKAEYDVTVVAVTVDDKGIIVSCIIDSVGTTVAFDGTGTITSDLTAEVLTKNELGDNYNMKLYGGAKYEWYEQAAALANYAVGKTVDELKNGAVNESGYAVDADLASMATINLYSYVNGIEAAVNNATHLGAQGGDELKLAVTSSVGGSSNATADKNGTAQLDCTVVALTAKDGVITSCAIDSVQAKVSFDATGAIKSDVTAPVQTKNELGDAYNMKLYGGAIAEWNEQAASFASYVTGKTADQVAGIAVSEGKPTDADLASSVTIAIGDFQNLIVKALS